MSHASPLPEPAFLARFSALRNSRDPVFILFTSTRSPATGERWCPDCASSDAVIEEAFSSSAPASATLLTVEIERSRWKEDPGKAHAFRQDPFLVRSIPTIVEWDGANQRVARRVQDCEQMELLADLFAKLPTSSPS